MLKDISVKDINFLIVGVGGQGTVLSGDILAQVGMAGGYDAKKSDVLGLAIRSGSVVSHVRWGGKVNAPMSMKGQVDYLLAYEPLESLRMVEFLGPGSTVLVNSYRIPPVSVTTGRTGYPSEEEVRSLLQGAAEKLYFVNATGKAQGLGNVRVVNVLLLGALSSLLDSEVAIWEEVIANYVPAKYQKVNLRAFKLGKSLLSNEGSL